MKNNIIIFPTDTVYGIGCPLFDLESTKRIFEIKKRPLNKPLAVLCYDLAQIEEICIVNEKAKALINKFLPGPVTFILEAKEEVKNKINLKTIGIRIPNSKIALNILKEKGPMSTTSVNDSGQKPLDEYEDIVLNYKELVAKIYPKEEMSSSISSTVIDLTTDEIKVLREGQITLKMIEDYLNSL